MTHDRFLALLDIYGADLGRWPEAERAAARALAAQGSPELRQQMAEAALLDGLLDGHTVARPREALIQQTIAAVLLPPQTPSARERSRWNWLWPSVGLAGIALAGSLTGVMAVSVALRGTAGPVAGDWPEHGTAFSSAPAELREE